MRQPVRDISDLLYKRIRQVPVGLDADLTDGMLAGFVMQRSRNAFRAGRRGYPGRFLGPRVRIATRSCLHVGSAVSVGADVEISALSREGIFLADRVTIDTGAVLRGSGVVRHLGVGIRVGPRSSIGAYNVLLGQGGIDIGSDCLLGPHVTVVSENHNTGRLDIPIRAQGETRAPVFIGDDVWVGAGATILAGCKIGSGSVIAAGAVVRGDVPPGVIVGGVPAKVLRDRVVDNP